MRIAACVVTLVACRSAVSTVTVTSPETKPIVTPSKHNPIVIGDVVGTFGCPGWSPTRHLALCFVGSTAMGAAPEVTAKFVALEGRAKPLDSPIVLPSFGDKEPLPVETLAKLRAATRDFVAWDEEKIVGKGDRVGPLTITTRSSETSAGGENAAPRVHWDLVVRAGTSETTVDTTEAAISAYDVTAYRAESSTILMRTYSIADEGQYEQHADVYVCDATSCAAP